jgi:hypothetical protein
MALNVPVIPTINPPDLDALCEAVDDSINLEHSRCEIW